MDLSNLDADTPAWVAKAAKQVNANTTDLPSGLGQSITGALDAMHDEFSDELGEEFVEDVTPMASSGLEQAHRTVQSSIQQPDVILPKVSDVDQESAILEAMFPDGIPASAIKKAVFVSSIVTELLQYVNGDHTALANIEVLASEQK